MNRFEIVTLKSGAKSLRSVELNETFHPVTGPFAEANRLHVCQQRLVERCRGTGSPFVIWDVGLGAGANALAAIEALAGCGRPVEIHSFDKTTTAIEFALAHADELAYPVPHAGTLQKLLADQSVDAFPNIRWVFHPGDFRETIVTARFPTPDAIFYDPYSPAVNREMWTLEQFERVCERLDPARPCLLTNYSRSTAVRVTLLLAGFYAGTGEAVGEKDETTIAANCASLLANPFGAEWLGRVKKSTNATPLRDHGAVRGPISAEDWERLLRHPQFAGTE